MKKLAIALYSGLALTVWLIFLPPTGEFRTPYQDSPKQAHSHFSETANAPQETPIFTSKLEASGKIRNRMPDQAVNIPDLPTPSKPAEQALNSDVKNDENDREILERTSFSVELAHTQKVAQQPPSLDSEKHETPLSSANTNRTSNITGFAYQASAMNSNIVSAAETSVAPLASNTAGQADTVMTNTKNTGTSNDENPYLPQVDTSTIPRQLEPKKPEFVCPKHCYLQCTAYEINMLAQQGCPIPTD